VSGTLYF
jgi:hypothetical protein